MGDVNNTTTSHTQFAIDQLVEELLGKLLDGSITEPEKAQYADLVARRSITMRPHYRMRGSAILKYR